jgi:hypothetical protein
VKPRASLGLFLLPIILSSILPLHPFHPSLPHQAITNAKIHTKLFYLGDMDTAMYSNNLVLPR